MNLYWHHAPETILNQRYPSAQNGYDCPFIKGLALFTTQVSCGVGQFSELPHFVEFPRESLSAIVNSPAEKAQWIFSDMAHSKSCNGSRVAFFITQNKLGTLVESPTVPNPNSGNVIQTWIWTVSKREIAEFLSKNEKIDTLPAPPCKKKA